MSHAMVILTLIAFADPPKANRAPSVKELQAITKRGRELAGYDLAAWHASDAVQAKQPKPGSVVRYIARNTDAGWTVAFGRLDGDKNVFVIAYEAKQAKDPNKYAVQAFDPPKEDRAYFRAAANAIEVALGDFAEHFQGEQRPYNVAVLPGESGQLWLYLVPAPTQAGVWPLGGDIRYLISADGTKIVAKRQLHKSIIELPPPKADDPNKLAMGVHTHVLDNVPEDTDVFHVLTRKPTVPEMVTTERFVFQIGVDGKITNLGKSEDVLKKR